MSIGHFPKMLSQQILVGIISVGRLGVLQDGVEVPSTRTLYLLQQIWYYELHHDHYYYYYYYHYHHQHYYYHMFVCCMVTTIRTPASTDRFA